MICFNYYGLLLSLCGYFIFAPHTDVVAGIFRTTARVQNVGPEKIPMGVIALWCIQNVLGLANTDCHILRSDRGPIQRQFR